MNPNFLLHDTYHATTAVERPAPWSSDAVAFKKKALERWENEGGKIPELLSLAQRHSESGRFRRR